MPNDARPVFVRKPETDSDLVGSDAYDPTMRRDTILAWFATVAFVGGGIAYVVATSGTTPPPLRVSATPVVADIRSGVLAVPVPPPRTIDPYRGYGTWVDVFDFSPPYAGPSPSLRTADLQEMAAAGVTTVYLQAARLDDRSPSGLEDRWLLAEWLLRAHDVGIDVVAWYLPRFGEGTGDVDRVQALIDFEVLGQRFDGVGIDIEWTGDGVDDETRNGRLVALGETVKAANPDVPLGAIVLPPVLIEVVNEDFWPGFPWQEISPSFDVWLPMTYWSFRSDASGYGDGYSYVEESVRRLRNNIGDPDALVHPIGGIGGIDGIDDPDDPAEPLATIAELDNFAFAVADTSSIGASVYDWNTLDSAAKVRLTELFGS